MTMSEMTNAVKRPTSITTICVIGFLGALISVPLVLSDVARQVGYWYPPYLGLSAVIGLACMVGLWMMKRWAAYSYTVFVVPNQVVLLTAGAWSVATLLIPAVVVFFALIHVSEMS